MNNWCETSCSLACSDSVPINCTTLEITDALVIMVLRVHRANYTNYYNEVVCWSSILCDL